MAGIGRGERVRRGKRRCLWPAVVLALPSCAFLACGAEAMSLVQRPPRSMDFILVPRPPPVVPVEHQPARPVGDAVWVPGSWSWRASGWSWNRGAWVDPPAGASWSPWTWWYQADGQVRFWPARWFRLDEQPIDDPPPSAPRVPAALGFEDRVHLTGNRARRRASAHCGGRASGVSRIGDTSVDERCFSR
jgi:hypothetical protein